MPRSRPSFRRISRTFSRQDWGHRVERDASLLAAEGEKSVKAATQLCLGRGPMPRTETGFLGAKEKKSGEAAELFTTRARGEAKGAQVQGRPDAPCRLDAPELQPARPALSLSPRRLGTCPGICPGNRTPCPARSPDLPGHMPASSPQRLRRNSWNANVRWAYAPPRFEAAFAVREDAAGRRTDASPFSSSRHPAAYSEEILLVLTDETAKREERRGRGRRKR